MALDRRTLLRAGAASIVVGACRSSESTEEPPPPPAAVWPLSRPKHEGFVSYPDLPFPYLARVSIAELARELSTGELTAVTLVNQYITRIATLDPHLHSVLEVNRDAEPIARGLDAERAAGKLRGPLHGIPVLIKDNIDTGDALLTSAGSLAFERPAPRDAFVVAKLRAAGAIVFGKANLSEWANFRGNASLSGWSGRGGQCRNAYALDRTPSGSSSGSAVATAAGLCAVSLGSETDGSITSPAASNGCVGIKPTVGLVSRGGVIPISASQDTVGPIARTVADAALVLTAIAGFDPEDPITELARPEDYTKYLDTKALAKTRIGVPRKGWFGQARYLDTIMAAALDKLVELGAEIVEIELAIPPALSGHELAVFVAEMKPGMAAYLERRGDPKFRTLLDLVIYNLEHGDRELHLFGQEWFDAAQAHPGMQDAGYLEARRQCLVLGRDLLDAVIDGNQLDAICVATQPIQCVIDPLCGDTTTTGPYSFALPAVAGYPHITVPAGAFHEMPVGMSLIGKPFTEGKLFGFAYAFEQATKHRKPPRYLSTVPM